MGLDLVELTMALEDAFEVPIPNDVARTLLTPGMVVDYLVTQLNPATNPKCLEQRAFFELRRALVAVTGRRRNEISPQTRWVDILSESRWSKWRQIREHLGPKEWPSLQPAHFGKATVGDTAAHLAAFEAGRFTRGEGWHRADVEHVVRRLMLYETGVEQFEWSDQFVRDLQLD